MKKRDIGNRLLLVAVLFLTFMYGVIVEWSRVFPYSVLRPFKESAVLVVQEFHTWTGLKPDHFLQPARYDGNGVVSNKTSDSSTELVLLSGFFEDTNELRLITHDGAIVARWPVRFSEIFPNPSHLKQPPITDWNVDLHGALAEPDGSVVFNFEYGGLVKLDRCRNPVWALPRATHHSVEHAGNGGYWVPATRTYPEGEASPFPPFETPFNDDTLLKVSDEGEILAEYSVAKIFYDNGLGALLSSTGEKFEINMSWDSEIVHLNKIEVLTDDLADDFPLFDAGDLALSLRKLNMLMVVDARDLRVKWWRIGPWLRQHDPEFIRGGKIIVFNNNIFRTAFGDRSDISDKSIPRVSNILEIDPVAGSHRIIYGNRSDQRLLSVLRGKVESTPRNGLLITEFEGGRVFETDSEGNIIWQYVNRYDSEMVAELTEARLYPRRYFHVSDWSCDELRKK